MKVSLSFQIKKKKKKTPFIDNQGRVRHSNRNLRLSLKVFYLSIIKDA
jgi:hypothetical protein